MTAYGVEDFDDESSFAADVSLDDDVSRAQRLARLLDSQFELFGVRFGLDPIVGLAPVVGDTIGFLAGLYPIHVVRKHKLGKALERRMIANLAIDWLLGAVPVIGDVLDVTFKANLMNVRLLKHAASTNGKRHRRRTVQSRAVA